MKNLTISAFVLMMAFGSAAVAQAPTASVNQEQTKSEVVKSDDRVQIKPEELPADVTKALASDKFKGWTLHKAYVVKSTPEHYEVDMKKDEEVKTYKFTKEGTIIE